jgi:CubicO group peptidase (beta-lactamase class C family)
MEPYYTLQRSQPEAQGISSRGIIDFLDAIQEQKLELHSLMLLRHGHVVAEGWWAPYKANLPHMLFSLSKSFTSTAIGLLAAEGQITLDDQVISFFPDETPQEVSPNLAAMQIRHLLMMGTGHAQDTMVAIGRQENRNWVEAFLQATVEHVPGTHFVYNTGATYMLSAILQKVTGIKLLDYLEPRLMEPLGILGATWESCPRGIHTGGFGLSITTEDIAKFGQLYLQQGTWNGRQLITSAWIEEATSKQISNGDGGANDWAQGYGYQFWRCQHGHYRADGAFGQLCVVMSEYDTVLAVTAGENDIGAILNTVWSHMVPAIKPDSLAANPEAVTSLDDRLKALKLPLPHALFDSPHENLLSGKVYGFKENAEQILTFSITFNKEEAIAIIENSFGVHTIRLGRETWIEGTSSINQGKHQQIASSFSWRDTITVDLSFRFIETPFCNTITCTVEELDILLEVRPNVQFGPYVASPIRGIIV